MVRVIGKFLIFGWLVIVWTNLLFSQIAVDSLPKTQVQDTTIRQQMMVAIIELGTANPNIQAEGGRIADTIYAHLMADTSFVTLDRMTVEAQMSQNQITLDKLSVDSSYWSDIARQLGARKIFYGQVLQLNDTTMFADIYLTDVLLTRTRKAVLTYNPYATYDTTFSERIQTMVLGLISEPKPAKKITVAPKDGDQTLLWVIGSAILVGGGIVTAVLFGNRTEASSNDLPQPPQPPQLGHSP
jgi:hypothetical protein